MRNAHNVRRLRVESGAEDSANAGAARSALRLRRFGICIAASVAASFLLACGGKSKEGSQQIGEDVFNDAERDTPRGPIACPESHKSPYFVAYDTSGDQRPDVRRYVRKSDDGIVLPLCREADLDGDGIYDYVMLYSPLGRPSRAIADRDFDGKIDKRAYYQNGEVVWQELDVTGDGVLETRVYYEKGAAVRAERDLAGRSREGDWKPDTWEYYDDGNLVRIGRDTDGDGIVDSWQRSEALDERYQNT